MFVEVSTTRMDNKPRRAVVFAQVTCNSLLYFIKKKKVEKKNMQIYHKLFFLILRKKKFFLFVEFYWEAEIKFE